MSHFETFSSRRKPFIAPRASVVTLMDSGNELIVYTRVHYYLLRWSDALLLVELCALLGFAVQAEALLKGLLLQH